ncbi:transporter substrate-binding domain-containing protein [Solibacillus daqui]|uniref:transporter substrate-binding domain-containing protein n=1 Tax=Solibacillus daqui TaxID=2912187 RepID=UPI002366A33B|nr:transporter substrate-binding domain-containing protein [Solibacillus daqui]
MKFKQIVKLATISIAASALLAACGNDTESGSASSSTESKDGVTVVKVAYDQAGKPMTYLDENGNPTGYDVEVMKLVDEALPDYEFEYVGTTNDDLLIGVEQGKYHAGVKNAFWTEERTQKYIFPKEFLGLSSAGLVLKKENEHIKNLSDFASAGYTLAPIAANNAQYTVIAEYNEANPDNPVKLQAGEEFTVDVVQWVNEGRVDGGVQIEGSFTGQVLTEGGPYYNLKDEVVYNEFAVIKTWPLFNKKQQEFADAYDKAITEIKKTDALKELSKEFYGKDLFEVLDSVNR